MEQLLAKYILYEPSNITRDFVNNLIVEQHVTKSNICSYVTHFFCAHALTCNIWVLEQIKRYFELIAKCRVSDKTTLSHLCYGLFHLLANVEKKHFKFYDDSERKELFCTDISNIIHTSQNGDNADISQLKDILNPDVYKLLNIMYDAFLYNRSVNQLQQCFVILRYFITLQPRNYYAEGKKLSMDIFDFVFLICIAYSQNVSCPYTSKYISLTKDLFYYQLKKKDRSKRVNLLFFLFYVIIHKQIDHQEIDYEGAKFIEELYTMEDTQDHNKIKEGLKEKDITQDKDKTQDDAILEKCQYLFIYTHYDDTKCQQIQAEKERNKLMAKLMRTTIKSIEVDSFLTREPSDSVYVAKLI